MQSNFVRTVRPAGPRPRTVLLKHATRNSILPVFTVLGLQVGTILGGTVILESIFSIPGTGLLDLPGGPGPRLPGRAGLRDRLRRRVRRGQPRRRSHVRPHRSSGPVPVGASDMADCPRVTGRRPRPAPSRAPPVVVTRRRRFWRVRAHPADGGRGAAHHRALRPRWRSSRRWWRRTARPSSSAPRSSSRPSGVPVRHRRPRPRRAQPGRSTAPGPRCSSRSPPSSPPALIGTAIGVALGLLRRPVARLAAAAGHGRVMAVPGLVLLLFIAAVLGPSIRNTIIALIVLIVPSFNRVARGEMLRVREEPYVEAARANGCGVARILVRTACRTCSHRCRGHQSAVRRRAHRGVGAELPGHRHPAAHRLLGTHAQRGHPVPGDLARGWSSSPAARSPSRSSPSTCSATGCATSSTPAAVASAGSIHRSPPQEVRSP